MAKQSALEETTLEDTYYMRTLGGTLSADEFTAEATRRRVEKAKLRPNPPAEPVAGLDSTADLGSGGAPRYTESTWPPRMPERSIRDKLPLLEGREGAPRYTVSDMLGTGAMGRVFSAYDHDLRREVAVKQLHGDYTQDRDKLRRFVREAQITAQLEHPNILPIYNLNCMEGGQVYFTMRKSEGVSLGESLRKYRKGEPLPREIETLYQRVDVLRKVCDAVAYAHHRGIVHQDIKPDNIMIGRFGEAVLVDWGTAYSPEFCGSDARRRLMGTPLYMSPEQARRELADQRSDIYCLGATLFYMLVGRHPTYSSDPDEFWQRKRAGEVDPPAEEERQGVPPRLLAIAMQAMAPAPEDRYQSVQDFEEDLRRWQEGQAVDAYQDTMADRLVRWYRNHRREVWIGALVLLLVGFLAGLYAREKAKEVAPWEELYSQSFDDMQTAELAEHWVGIDYPQWRREDARPIDLARGHRWRVDDGALIGEGMDFAGALNLTFLQSVRGNMRVDWEVTPLQNSVNVNAYIGAPNRWEGYTFHIGGWGVPRSCVMTRGVETKVLDYYYRDEPLQPGRTYHMAMELADDRVRFLIDGEEIFDYRELEPMVGSGHGQFGFEVARNDVRIDNVRVQHQLVPEKITALDRAAVYEEVGQYEKALRHYREIRQAYAGLAPRALYGIGRTYVKMGRPEQAMDAYQEFIESHPGSPMRPMVMAELIRLLVRAGRMDEAESLAADLMKSAPERAIVNAVLFELSENLLLSHELSEPGAFAREDLLEQTEQVRRTVQAWAARLRLPIERNIALRRCAAVLNDAGHHDIVVAKYRSQPEECVRALQLTGQTERIPEMFPREGNIVASALIDLGRAEQAVERYPQSEAVRAYLRDQSGQDGPERAELARQIEQALMERPVGEVLADQRFSNDEVFRQMVTMGRFDDLLAAMTPNWDYWIYTEALVRGRRLETIFSEMESFRTTYQEALALTGLEMHASGDPQGAAVVLDRMEALPYRFTGTGRSDLFFKFMLTPVLQFFSGEEHQARETLQERAEEYSRYFGGELTSMCLYVLGEGPAPEEEESTDGVLEGLRMEFAGRHARALERYRTRLDETPATDRGLEATFVRWRVRQLSGL